MAPHRILAAAALLTLGACQTAPLPQAAPSSSPLEPSRPGLAVEAEGLRWFLPPNGSARPLPFGTDKETVLRSLELVRGPAGRGVNRDCGAGPVETATWADGLSLVFQDDKFAGWGLDGRATGAIGTANGIGPGTTRAALTENVADVRVFPSTLGTEFSAGGYFGLLDGNRATSRITDMWAGVSCVAR